MILPCTYHCNDHGEALEGWCNCRSSNLFLDSSKTIGTMFRRLIIMGTWCLQEMFSTDLTKPRNWVVDCPQHLPSAPHVADANVNPSQPLTFFGQGWYGWWFRHPAITSWYGESTIIYRAFIHLRWFSRRISNEPSNRINLVQFWWTRFVLNFWALNSIDLLTYFHLKVSNLETLQFLCIFWWTLMGQNIQLPTTFMKDWRRESTHER